MTTKQFSLLQCRYCSLKFQPVDWLAWRAKGFCCEKCFLLDESPKFERWFAKCVLLGVEAEACPDDYGWNLQKPGNWLVRFRDGDTPEQAILSQFYAEEVEPGQIQLLH